MSYYHGLISSRRANSLLNQRPDGSFLIRDSQSQPGNFVLSAKYFGRMYHILIFQQGGKYVLDSAGEAAGAAGGGEEGGVQFSSLDELVLFLTGHNLKVGEDEVKLTDTCPCVDDTTRLSSNTISKVKDCDDTDLMTDVFANLFGKRCVVICVAHSSVSLDGKVQHSDQAKTYWVALVKDLDQKGYFIRTVDKEEKKLIREKKVGKGFQYDMPSGLVMTFLSEDGITCIGFQDTQEKDRFLHQIDRVVKLQQERSLKLRDRSDSGAATGTAKRKPTEVIHRIKASEFDVDAMNEEWRHLFSEAGVTEAMLRDKATLQFILDTVYQIGGEPPKLTVGGTGDETDGPSPDVERMQALAVDEKLKKESVRASMLSDILRQTSLKVPAAVERGNVCSFLAACERYKDHLIIKHSMIALGPEKGSCYCQECASGKQVVLVTGNPPQQYTLPVGWAQFMHSSQSHSLARHITRSWHVAYCRVPAGRVAGVMRTGQLVHSQSSGEVSVSPDIQRACALSHLPPDGFHDKVSGQYHKVQTVFQVFLQPDTYSVHLVEEGEGQSQEVGGVTPLHSKLEWRVKERTYIVHSLWISMTPAE